MPDYLYTDDMVEISGFGGGYEAACRSMVKAGCEWFDAHPNAQPKFHGYKGFYGLIEEDNQDAKDLSAAVLAAANGDSTGAMHQAAIGHILAIHRSGWDWYVGESRRRYAQEQAAARLGLGPDSPEQ